MGNHSAGQSMALGAAHALQTRQPGQTAISLLDKVCARYVDCDAEFESEDPDNPGTVHPEFDDTSVRSCYQHGGHPEPFSGH